jgi:hypothetical protein
MKLHIVMSCLIFCLLPGCAHLPSDREIDALGGKKTLVLLRIVCVVGGEETKPYSTPFLGSGVISALANLETGGVPIMILPQFLSWDSAQDGWIYYLLPPGYHYIAFSGPAEVSGGGGSFDKRNRERADFWRIDVPDGAQAIYAGTFRFEAEGGDFLIGKQCERLQQDSVEIINQAGEARALVMKLLPSLTLSLAPIVVHQTSTFILRSPAEINKK